MRKLIFVLCFFLTGCSIDNFVVQYKEIRVEITLDKMEK
jgi:hypothetical protein